MTKLIKAYDYYFQQVQGMCGNSDGTTKGELTMPDRVTIAGTVCEFGRSWALSSGTCEPGNAPPLSMDPCNIESRVRKIVSLRQFILNINTYTKI